MKRIALILFTLLPIATHAQDWQPLAQSGNLTAMQQWVEAGGDVNARDENGATVLMWAAASGHVDLMRYLVERGADPTKKGAIWLSEEKTGYYGNLMGVVAGLGRLEALRFLIEEVGIDKEDRERDPETGEENGWRALQWAASAGHKEALAYLLSAGAATELPSDESFVPIMLAAGSGELFDILLEAGASLRVQDGDGATVLHYLAARGDVTRAQRAIAAGVDINAGISNGITPLGIAVYSGGELMVRLLLCRGAEGVAAAREIADSEGHVRLIPLLEASTCDEEALKKLLKAKALNGEVVQLYHQGHYEEATSKGEEAVRLRRDALGTNHPDYGTSLNNLALLYKSQGLYKEAEPLYKEALAVTKASLGTNHPDFALRQYNLAVLGFSLASIPFEEIVARLDSVLVIFDLPANQNQEPELQIRALYARGLLFRESEEKGAASKDLENAITILEQQRVRIGGSSALRASFLESNSQLYTTMMQWLIEDDEPEEAFSYLERARARSFLDQFNLATLSEELLDSIEEPQQSKLRERERLASVRVAELNVQISLARAKPAETEKQKEARGKRVEALSEELRVARTVYSRVDHDIRSQSRIWNEEIVSNSDVDRLGKVQRDIVPSNGYLLSYVVGKEASFVFALGKNDLWVDSLMISNSIAATAGVEPGLLTESKLDSLLFGGGQLRGVSVLPDASRSDIKPVRRRLHHKALQSLFQVLIPEKRREALMAAEELVIVPDGNLHALPFEMLAVGEGYWIDDESTPLLWYGPSATALVQMKAQHEESQLTQNRDFETLSLSDPMYALNQTAKSGPRADYEERGGPLTRLIHTADETAAIKQAYKTNADQQVQVLDRAAATEEALRKVLKGKKYIHLATHGLTDETETSGQGLFAALALTPPDSTGGSEENDGLLELREIYRLDEELKDVELAVLSACETHVGPRFKGEGVFALSRGFLTAGVRRVIASQWKVEDESTGRLIGKLFEQLITADENHEPLNYARALRNAQLAVKSNPKWADPYFWAPFVLIGGR